ncbi:MAG: hypothetical protein ACOYKR_04555 [Sphingobacterium thalpophilum]
MRIEGKSIISDSTDIRGFFITDTIVIERRIDNYLANYFCSKPKYRRQELIEMILSSDSMTFEKKKNIFKVVLKKHQPTFEKEYPELFPFLNSIIENRNIFAHYLLDTSKEALKRYPNDIGFVKYKNDTVTIWFNNEQLKDHLLKHNRVLKMLDEIFDHGIC